MKFSKIMFSAALAALFIPALAIAQAAGDPAISTPVYINACKRFKILTRLIDLDAEQKTAVANLLDDFRTELQETAEELEQAKRNLFITIHKPKEVVDEDEVRSAFQEVSTLEEDNAVTHTLLMNDIYQVVEEWQYRMMIAAHVNLHICATAPIRIFRRHLNRWINRHKDSSSSEE